MRTKRIGALCVLAGGLGLCAISGPRPRDLAPTHARAGMVLGEVSLPFVAMRAPVSSGPLDLVFVSSRCAACRSLVFALRAERRRPCRGHAVVFVTDTAWPDLSALAGTGVTVDDHGTRLAATLGVRATPTLVAVSRPGRRVVQVDVGSDAVGRHFVTRESACAPVGGES